MKQFKIKKGKKTWLVKAADKDSALNKLVEKGFIEKVEDKQLSYELIAKEDEAKQFAKEHNGTYTPYKTKDGSFDGFIVWYKDSATIKDSDKLKQLAYEFGQKGSYFDRANSAHSRNILGKDDEVKYQDFVNTGFKVYEQLKQEVDNVQRIGRSFGNYETWSDTLKLLKDGLDRLYWASDNVNSSARAKGKALAEKLDNLTKEYWQRMHGIKDEESPERKAQEWVDYDLKHYGHVSEETKDDIKKMGLDFDKWDNQVKKDCDCKPISDCDMSNVEVKDAANFTKYQYADACKYIDDAWYKITDNVADGILQAVGLTNRIFDNAWTKLKNLIDNDDKLSDTDKAELEKYF